MNIEKTIYEKLSEISESVEVFNEFLPAGWNYSRDVIVFSRSTIESFNTLDVKNMYQKDRLIVKVMSPQKHTTENLEKLVINKLHEIENSVIRTVLYENTDQVYNPELKVFLRSLNFVLHVSN